MALAGRRLVDTPNHRRDAPSLLGLEQGEDIYPAVGPLAVQVEIVREPHHRHGTGNANFGLEPAFDVSASSRSRALLSPGPELKTQLSVSFSGRERDSGVQHEVRERDEVGPRNGREGRFSDCEHGRLVVWLGLGVKGQRRRDGGGEHQSGRERGSAGRDQSLQGSDLGVGIEVNVGPVA